MVLVVFSCCFLQDFEAKNLAKESIKTVDEDEEEESVKVGANAIEEKKKQKQKNQITMPAIYFGFAVAAAFLLLKAHKKE